VEFKFNLNPFRCVPAESTLSVNGVAVPVDYVRNLRARRYLLRLREDGSARVTVPRGGSMAEAQHFAERNRAWLATQLQRHAARPAVSAQWLLGSEIFLRGERVKLLTETNNLVRVGDELVKAPNLVADLRPAVERHLWRLATKELPPKVIAFASQHQSPVRRITVRNQKSRWGSCSRRGTISLNWRLIQTPAFVQDYIVLHELMHLRQMNHSPKFWHEVEQVCPDYENAEQWLKQHSSLLL
jgi:predicted metal-dependent hydrolase